MSSHKTSPIPHTFRDWYPAKRKGGRERLRDRVTGKWGPWQRTPERVQAERILSVAVRAGGDVTPPRSAQELHALTVADLRRLAHDVYSEDFTTRTRKAQMVDAIVAMQHGRGVR